jgi:hypothetical protein
MRSVTFSIPGFVLQYFHTHEYIPFADNIFSFSNPRIRKRDCLGAMLVQYECSADAETAIEALNGVSYNNHLLTVKWDRTMDLVHGHFAVKNSLFIQPSFD